MQDVNRLKLVLVEKKKTSKWLSEELDVNPSTVFASGYNPKLDDGVSKNIAPLQKAGLLSYNVLNPSQLKKYLNADW